MSHAPTTMTDASPPPPPPQAHQDQTDLAAELGAARGAAAEALLRVHQERAVAEQVRLQLRSVQAVVDTYRRQAERSTAQSEGLERRAEAAEDLANAVTVRREWTELWHQRSGSMWVRALRLWRGLHFRWRRWQ